MASKLTWDQEVILVNEIKKYGVLFDNKHKHFRNLNKRDRVWEKICEKIGLPLSECKHRWGYLRGQYVKRKRIGVDKWEYGRNSGCNYMELLSFLSNTNDSDAYTDETPHTKKKKKDKKKEKREHHINDDDIVDITDVSEKKEHEKEYQINDETEEFEKNKHYNEDDTDGWQKNENDVKYDTDGSKKKKRKKKHLADNATDETEQKKRMEEHYAEDNTDNEFHARHKITKIQDIASPVKQNSIEANVLEPEIKLSETTVKGNMSIYNDSIASYKSPTHKFFETMADFVEKLPADLQAHIRLKVCHIVTEMEIKHHGQDVGETNDYFSQSYD